MSDAGRAELRVDPRPLVSRSDLYTVGPNGIASISHRALRLRTRVIRAAGLRTADATTMNQDSCPGVFVIGQADSANQTHSQAGCPNAPIYVLAVGLPRAGTAALSPGQAYDIDAKQAAYGYWAARVIRTAVGVGGSSVYAADYVLAKHGGTWVVLKVVGLRYTE